MALREFPEASNLVMDVILKDGPNYFGCDIPKKPFGDNERVISIWSDDMILVFPMEEVRCIRLYDKGANQ